MMYIRAPKKAFGVAVVVLIMSACVLLFSALSFGATVRAKDDGDKPAKPLDYTDAFNMPAGISPYLVVAADLNKDGYLDLATSNTIGHSVTVFINRGNGTFR